MFKFKYIDQSLAKKMSNIDQYYPPEVSQELSFFLKTLEEAGEVSRVDYFIGNINKIDANTFEMQYATDSVQKVVTVLDVKVKSIHLLKTRFSIKDSWDDKDVVACIPQCDKPEKMIQTLELISQGKNDSYDIGLSLGSQAKTTKNVRRHGQYSLDALEELRLIQRVKKGRKSELALTDKGVLIAKAPDLETKKRLLIEAMLNYKPVWLVIGEVTEGGKPLTDELVKKLVFPPEDQEADTSNRRSQTIKNWVIFISTFEGIPIYKSENKLQLIIPMLYANPKSENNL